MRQFETDLRHELEERLRFETLAFSTESMPPEAARNQELEIPVTIEVEPAKFEVDEGNRQLHRDTEKNVQKLIDMGLRAVLTMQSFITGQLMIELDFHSGSPVHLRNPAGDLIEIPTIPSTTEPLANALQQLDLKGIEKNLTNTLTGIDRLVNNPDLK
jgi:paraquat-inducible protein B